jgi:hypothetical protein
VPVLLDAIHDGWESPADRLLRHAVGSIQSASMSAA